MRGQSGMSPFAMRPVTWSDTYRRVLSCLFTFLLPISLCFSQTTDDYQTRASGDWSKKGTWQRWDGSSWTNNPNVPSSGDGNIKILGGHTVTVDSRYDVDQLTVAAGATLISEKRLRIVDGSGVDLSVSGTVTVGAEDIQIQTGSSVNFGSTGVLNIPERNFSLRGTASATFQNGSVVTITGSGRFSADQNSVTTFALGSTVNNGNTFRVRNSGIVNVSGLFVNSGTFDLQNTSQLNFLSGGVYQHAMNGGAFPSAALSTFASGSTALVTGVTSTVPTDLNHNFHHFTWSSALTNDLSLGGAPLSFGGNFTVTSTGGSALSWIENASTPLSISGNYIQTDGTFRYTTGTGDGLLSAHTVSISAGTLDMTNGSGRPTLSLQGNLSISGSGDLLHPSIIQFTGAVAQSLSYAPGTLVLPRLIVDNTAASVTLLTDLTISETASVRSGSVFDVTSAAVVLPHGSTLYADGSVSGSITMQRTYSLVANGWRMITSPLNGTYFSSLNASFLTQGGTWASQTQGDSNLELLNFGIQDWTPITGTDATFSENEGYILYMFKADASGTPVLGSTWSVTGTVRSPGSKSLLWNTNSTDSYNYVGNRTTSNLDWNAIVATSGANLGTTYSTWDPFLTDGGGLTGYKYYNSASGLGSAGRYIAPFTAFMVQPLAAGVTMNFSTSEAANDSSANYFGKRGSQGQVSSHIRLQLEGEGLAEHETYLTFDSDASDGLDPFDTDRLQPLSPEFTTLISLAGDRKLAFDGRSLEGGYQRFDLVVASTRAGYFELSWPELYDLPYGWSVSLLDHKDGRVIDMLNNSGIRFHLDESEKVSTNFSINRNETDGARFSVVLSALSGKGSAPEADLRIDPSSVVSQNFPNPFSESTSVRISLPSRLPVRMDIFDALGRRIDSVANSVYEAGWHEIAWQPQFVANGVYFYRVQIGATSITRSMIFRR